MSSLFNFIKTPMRMIIDGLNNVVQQVSNTLFGEPDFTDIGLKNLSEVDPVRSEYIFDEEDKVRVKNEGKFININRVDETYDFTELFPPNGIYVSELDDYADQIFEIIKKSIENNAAAGFLNITLLINAPRIDPNGRIQIMEQTRSLGFRTLNRWLNNINDIDDQLQLLIAEYYSSFLKGIVFEYVYPEEGGIKKVGAISKGAKFIEYGDDQVLYNPNTRNNCFVYCLLCGIDKDYMLCEFSKDPKIKKKLVNAVGALKTKCNLKMRCLLDRDDMAKLCKAKKTHVKVIGDAEFEIGDPNHRAITLIQKADHVMLLTDFKFSELNLPQEEGTKTTFYKRLSLDKEIDLDFFVADLETFEAEDGRQMPYQAGFTYYPDNTLDKTIHQLKPEVFSYKCLDCLEKFFERIYEIKKDLIGKARNATVFFHNGGKFDLDIILDRFIFNHDTITIDHCLFNNGRIMKMTISYRDISISFLDSISFLNGSLASITGDKGFPVIHKKLEFDHTLVTKDTWMNIDTDLYFRHDLLGLAEALDIYVKTNFKQFSINVINCVSAANVGKRILKSKYLDAKTIEVPEDESTDSFYRSSYHGGRTEIFFRGQLEGKYHYYDFTSLYPHTACLLLPKGQSRKTEFGKFDLGDEKGRKRFLIWCKGYCGIFKCVVKTIRFDVKPLFAVIHQNKLVFPHLKDWTELTLTSAEISKALEFGLYDIRILNGRHWFGATYLKDIHEELFKLKAESKAAGNLGESQTNKIQMNSIYGGLGMSLYNRVQTEIHMNTGFGRDYLFSRMCDETLKSFKQVGNSFICNIKSSQRCESAVQVASFITAYARCMLWELIYDIEQLGYKVVYGDTDSIFTDCDISKHPELFKKWVPDGSGKSLGSLKDELDGDYITNMTIIAPKCYSYTTSDGTLNKKFKGLPENRVTDTIHDELLVGNVKTERTVFTKSRCCKDEYGITIGEREVDFTGEYTKGIVGKDGWVTPLIL